MPSFVDVNCDKLTEMCIYTLDAVNSFRQRKRTKIITDYVAAHNKRERKRWFGKPRLITFDDAEAMIKGELMGCDWDLVDRNYNFIEFYFYKNEDAAKKILKSAKASAKETLQLTVDDFNLLWSPNE